MVVSSFVIGMAQLKLKPKSKKIHKQPSAVCLLIMSKQKVLTWFQVSHLNIVLSLREVTKQTF